MVTQELHKEIIVGNLIKKLDLHILEDEDKITILNSLKRVYIDVSTPDGYVRSLYNRIVYF